MGGCDSCRAIGRVISHSSMLTTDQTIMRAFPGNRSGGRVKGDE
jgi:hypothetical protein